MTEEDERAAAQDPATRVFAIFLDEFNVAPGVNSARVREAATKFLTESIRPGDLLYVLKPMDPVNGFRFTRDRAAAQATIARFEGRKGDYAPRTAFETQYIGRTPAAVDGARAQIVTTGLREMIMAMGELRPARGAIVLISEGFSGTAASERRRLPDWQGLARASSHFNLPIYTFDPRDPVPRRRRMRQQARRRWIAAPTPCSRWLGRPAATRSRTRVVSTPGWRRCRAISIATTC